MYNIILALIVCLVPLGCKSVYEKQGDEHLMAGDGLSALQRYQLVKEGKGSADFPKNLTLAYILGMAATSDALGEPEIILTYREKILAALSSLPGTELKELYLKTIVEASGKFYSVPDPRFRKMCRTFKNDVYTLGGSQAAQEKMLWIVEEADKREEEALKAAGKVKLKYTEPMK